MIRVALMGLITTAFLNLSVARADDWPQWLGRDRDSVWHETEIIDKFPEAGLTVKWRAPVSLGYSGPAVVGDRVFVTDYVRESGDVSNSPNERKQLVGRERVLCLNAKDGSPVWEHADKVAYKISYPSGPRVTPTVAEGKVYTLGAEGRLLCLNVSDGSVVWAKELKQEYKIEAPLWGFCGAPLIDGDKLICLVGGDGSVAVAFDRNTGREIWKALSASEPGYCPPSIITAAGRRQLIIWSADALNSLDPETGKIYWSKPLQPSYGMSIAIPRKHGNLLFASGIGAVGAAFKLDETKPGAEVAWKGSNKTAVYAANTTPVIDHEGIIYGADCMSGQFRAIAGGWYMVLMQLTSAQQARNDFLKTEIARLEAQIKDIATLRAEIEALKARQKAVEDLQTDRNTPVYLLDELVKQTPEGVYLTSIKQNGTVVLVTGMAQTNERVSEFLRNTLYNSPWLEKPELVEIKTATPAQGSAGATGRDQRRLNEFSMRLSLKRPQAPAAASAPAAAASAPADKKAS